MGLGRSMTSDDNPPQGFKWDPTPEGPGNEAGQPLYGSPQQILQGSQEPMIVRFDQSVQQQTQATAALVVSLIALVGGFLFFFPFILAPVSLILANKSLSVTEMYPGHTEHGVARAAQIISLIIVTLLLLGVIIIGLFLALLMTNGF